MKGYCRVHPDRRDPRWWIVDLDDAYDDMTSGLIFFDVAGKSVGGWLYGVAAELRDVDDYLLPLLRKCTHAIVRSPVVFSDEEVVSAALAIRDLIADHTQWVPTIGIVDFTIGERVPRIWWSEDVPDNLERRLLASARSVELLAIAKEGKAHWQPQSFHYEAPSGEHRQDFIRVGDAFRSPRDAVALGTWLYQHVEPKMAILLDSSTMVPIVMALQTAVKSAGMELGPIVARDAYPYTMLKDEELVELTAGGNGVLALISVSSTGRTVKSLAAALERKISGRWTIETLIDRTKPASSHWPEGHAGTMSPWLHVANTPTYTRENCELPGRDRYVRIDPSSFANTALPEPEVVVMPDPPLRARAIGRLLELYERTNGMGIDCKPSDRAALRSLRHNNRWGVRFYPERILTDVGLVDALNDQLTADRGDKNDGRLDLDRLRSVDSIVVLKDEYGLPGFDVLLQWAKRTFGNGNVAIAQINWGSRDRDADQLRPIVEQSSHVLVMTLSAVTGETLEEMLVRIHSVLEHRPSGSYDVSGLVVHARPRSFKEWQAIRSAYNRRLVAMWMTYLPRDRSPDSHPMAEEQRLYRQTLQFDELPDHARLYAEDRGRTVLFNNNSNWMGRFGDWKPNHGYSNPAAVLLCNNPDRSSDELPKLLNNSLFGDSMSMVGTLIGVGAALHRQRLEKGVRGGPPGLQFDLGRIPFVYFEVPILCAMLRWIQPDEAYWGDPDLPLGELLTRIWRRAKYEEEGNREMLLAELALAAAAGKIPSDAKEALTGFYQEMTVGSSADGTDDVALLAVTKHLLELAWGPFEEEEMGA